MSKIEKDNSFKDILSRLMADRGLKEADIVKASGLPQATISNILRGKSKYPRHPTVRRLAELFNFTIEELLSYNTSKAVLLSEDFDQPLDSLEESLTDLAPAKIPLLKWLEVRNWVSDQFTANPSATWLVNDTCKSAKAFALTLKPSMHIYFLPPVKVGGMQEGILLVDPKRKVKDGLIVLVLLAQSTEPVLRLLIVEDKKQWLKPLEKGLPSVAVGLGCFIVGPIVEFRCHWGVE